MKTGDFVSTSHGVGVVTDIWHDEEHDCPMASVFLAATQKVVYVFPDDWENIDDLSIDRSDLEVI